MSSTFHLGVVISNRLTWSAHINQLIVKANPKLCLLLRMVYGLHLPSYAAERCYMSMVRPIFEYCSAVLASCSKGDALRLEKLQIRVARDRAVLHASESSSKQMSSREVLARVNWPTLPAWRRQLHVLCLFWRLRHGQGPPSLRAAVPQSASILVPQYKLRKTESVQLPLCSSSKRLLSFIPATAIL